MFEQLCQGQMRPVDFCFVDMFPQQTTPLLDRQFAHQLVVVIVAIFPFGPGESGGKFVLDFVDQTTGQGNTSAL